MVLDAFEKCNQAVADLRDTVRKEVLDILARIVDAIYSLMKEKQ